MKHKALEKLTLEAQKVTRHSTQPLSPELYRGKETVGVELPAQLCGQLQGHRFVVGFSLLPATSYSH